MDVADVMNQVGEALDTIPKLRIITDERSKINVPAGVVALPRNINYEGTYVRGLDYRELEVGVMVGRSNERTAKIEATRYAAGSGVSSVVQALNSKTNRTTENDYTYSACDTVTVANCRFVNLIYADQGYLTAIFTVKIAGSGD